MTEEIKTHFSTETDISLILQKSKKFQLKLKYWKHSSWKLEVFTSKIPVSWCIQDQLNAAVQRQSGPILARIQLFSWRLNSKGWDFWIVLAMNRTMSFNPLNYSATITSSRTAGWHLVSLFTGERKVVIFFFPQLHTNTSSKNMALDLLKLLFHFVQVWELFYGFTWVF